MCAISAVPRKNKEKPSPTGKVARASHASARRMRVLPLPMGEVPKAERACLPSQSLRDSSPRVGAKEKRIATPVLRHWFAMTPSISIRDIKKSPMPFSDGIGDFSVCITAWVGSSHHRRNRRRNRRSRRSRRCFWEWGWFGRWRHRCRKRRFRTPPAAPRRSATER